MDLGTLLGVVSGVGLIVWAIYLGGSIKAFMDIPSVMITMGGTVAATMIAYPARQVVSVARVIRHVLVRRLMGAAEAIELLVRFAEKARREGLLALEDEAEQLDDPFLKKGVQLVVDGTDPELVRNILETELAFLEERHKVGQSMFETMAALAPAFGMIGTLIGLIQMLKNLDKPETIGPGLATALITTFYGALMANLLFTPVAGKLKVKSGEEVLLKEVMVEGILSIQSGDNPRIVEEKLKAFLSPAVREAMVRGPKAAVGDEEA